MSVCTYKSGSLAIRPKSIGVLMVVAAAGMLVCDMYKRFCEDVLHQVMQFCHQLPQSLCCTVSFSIVAMQAGSKGVFNKLVCNQELRCMIIYIYLPD